jgi:hypothetical protein
MEGVEGAFHELVVAEGVGHQVHGKPVHSQIEKCQHIATTPLGGVNGIAGLLLEFGAVELQLLFPLVRVNCALGVIMVIAVSCVKLLSAHNSTQHTSRKHKV